MGKASRTKGAGGEREFAAYLNGRMDFDLRYERASRIGRESADVAPTKASQSSYPRAPRFEVKRRKALPLWLSHAFKQALEADGFFAIREDNGAWWVCVPGAQFTNMMNELDWDTSNWSEGE